jgi:hypothetical protein
MKNKEKLSYYELAVHSKLQVAMFVFLFLAFLFGFFVLLLNLTYYTVENYLEGTVYNAGETLPKIMGTLRPEMQTDYLTSWAIDIYLNTPQESRYWLNPIMSLILPVALLSLISSLIITSVMPITIGFMRQKIEREIVFFLDSIMFRRAGTNSDDITDNNYEDLVSEIMSANLRDLQELHQQLDISIEDLKVLQRALYWRNGTLRYKLFHIANGLTMYMRFYFSEKYSNGVLGLVYIGAAFLIIIIGMRGLKFIPSTQPSLVFFALGLEFSMLVTYAFTLMFSRSEETQNAEQNSTHYSASILLPSEFGNSKEVESLLKVFIKTHNKSDDKSI